jgi:GTP-binding protein HflX
MDQIDWQRKTGSGSRKNMEKALLVTVKFKHEDDEWPIDDIAAELEELVIACGVKVVENVKSICDKPTPNYLIGSGKAKELAELLQAHDADVLIFSRDLSGTQQRNLEEITGKKIIDRTQLILDIFARHAKTPEGKTQVELAQLQYLLPRLIGKGLILSRIGGGLGTRGPGEQKLELDRRRIRSRIDSLNKDLKALNERRKIMRKKRTDNSVPLVALVGYTSAGKSTLLNSLTGAEQIVSSGLFTTLDPLARTLQLDNGEKIVISDTVGFLHNLPHNLIKAFQATLEEVVQADLLIHVLDISSPHVYEYSKAVFTVLGELGVDDKPIITALNKTDLFQDKIMMENMAADFVNPVLISAKLKEGLDKLTSTVERYFSDRMASIDLVIPHNRMDLVDLIYKQGKVEKVDYTQKGARIIAVVPKIIANKLLKIDKLG